MSLLRRAIVVAATAALGGCVLLVDSFDTSDHCGLQGTSECAQCIKSRCQVPIDRCCNDRECLGGRMLGAMDACGRGEIQPCNEILSAPRAVLSEEEIRSCVAAGCRQECTTATSTTRPKWACAASRDQTTDCALCVYVNCILSIDACCADATCKTDANILTDIGACVTGDARGCAYLLDDSRSTSGLAGAIRACIDESCAGRCMNEDRLPHTKCSTYHAQGDYCQCTNAEASGGPNCAPGTIGSNADCVLGTDGCTCGQYACTDTGLGCTCAFVGGIVGTSCTKPTGGICCAKRSSASVTCYCEEYSSCRGSNGEEQVPSCSREDVLAWAGNAVVSSCSR